jgi:hypothetical protein
MDGDDQGLVLRGLTNARLNMEPAESRAWCKSAFITLLVGILNVFAGPTLAGSILVHVCRGGEAVMMGLAWKSLESRIRRDPDFRHQMIETYRKAFRDNPHLGEEFDVFLMKLGIQAEVRSQDES